MFLSLENNNSELDEMFVIQPSSEVPPSMWTSCLVSVISPLRISPQAELNPLIPFLIG
jgi:hypothetical protein